MANLTNSTNWTGSNEQTYQEKTYNFSTKDKYVNKNISYKVTVPGMNVSNGTASEDSSFWIQPGTVAPMFTFKVDASGNVWVE